ncbi:EamA family transporter [Candidatus Woesearchaeota archaeon]|nr:EamA family transporter [Candidatus Woesearchaeota archaeon]
MITRLGAIGLVIVATLIGSWGPIFLKKATTRLDRDAFTGIAPFLRATIGNLQLVLGIGFYAASFVIYVFALRGADLSVIYPLVSTSYVWVSLLSVWMLKERMTAFKWAGILLIIAGATLVGVGS